MFKSILGAIIVIGIIIGVLKAFPILGIILAVVAVSIAVYFIVKFIKNKNEEKVYKTAENNHFAFLKNEKNIYFVETDIEKAEREEHRKTVLENKANKFNEDLAKIEPVAVSITDKKIKKRALAEMPEIKYSKITRKTNIQALFPLVIIDVETTGLNCRKNEIIEVSAIKYEADFTPDFCFTTLCKSKNPLPDEIKTITTITDDMIADSPAFENVVDSLTEFINGCNIFGYNLEFDLKFLFVHGLDLPTKAKYYDVMELVKSKLKRAPYNSDNCNYDVLDYKLDTIAKYYNIYRNNAHRSLSDCLATGKVLENLIEEFIE